MNTMAITKKLIQIPSFLAKGTDESLKAKFIYFLLKKRTKLIITKQYIDKKRFNVIAKDSYPTKLLLAGHIDTVEPKPESKYDSLKPVIEGRKLYGLGSVDMLSGVASIISFLLRTKTKGVCALFYISEEYDFAGMKKFINDNKNLSAKLCVITEPTNLKICNAHRGLIEVEYIIKGLTAHASRPKQGINAIVVAIKAVEKLGKLLSKKYRSDLVGISTCNLSKIEGGLNLGTTNENLVLSEGTNSVADICKIRLDIRPATIDLKEKVVCRILSREVKKLGGNLSAAKSVADLGCLSISKNSIAKVTQAVKDSVNTLEFINPNDMGYGDGQMVFEKFGIPTVYFGAGPTNMCHKPNEYVNIPDLTKLDKFLDKLYQAYR